MLKLAEDVHSFRSNEVAVVRSISSQQQYPVQPCNRMIKTPADALADQASGAPLEALGRSVANESRYTGSPVDNLVRRNSAAFGERAAGRSSSGGTHARHCYAGIADSSH